LIDLVAPARVPLETNPSGTRRAGRLNIAFLASCIFHAAIAALFVAAMDQAVMIEGSDEPSQVMLGNSADDQRAAGDEQQSTDVTNVTLVTMLDATPVTTVAEVVEPVETVEPQRLESVQSVPVHKAATLVPDVTGAEASQEAATPNVDAARPIAAKKAEPITAEPMPDVLASETLAPSETDNIVQPRTKAAAQAEADVTAPTELTPAEAVAPSAPIRPEPVDVLTAEAEVQPKPEQPRADPRPKKTAETAKKPAVKKPEAKSEKKKAAAKAETKPAEKAAKAGSGGKGKADAKKGVADGSNNGKALAKGKGGKGGAGNAAVSNYPGKVVAKLRRSLRGIPRSAIKQAKNDVQVGFTVGANGSVSGVRITRSSGSASLDKAALAVVRRAAPFPAIPPDAGRSSWAFAVPLGVAR